MLRADEVKTTVRSHESSMGLLDGKSVIITGSGRGIGAGCALGAARQGANVVVNGVDEEPARETVAAIEAEGGSATACVADVTSWSEVHHLVQTCLEDSAPSTDS